MRYDNVINEHVRVVCVLGGMFKVGNIFKSVL